MSASASSPEAQRKRRRAQDGTATKPRSAACTGCSSRKVACKGLDLPGAVGCLSCVAHGLPCSRAPKGATIVEMGVVERGAGGVRLREGKTISKLRKTVASDTALSILHLGPTSSTSRLASVELGGSLSWSLVNSAFDKGSIISTAPVTELVKNDFRSKGMRLDGLDVANEIMFACYVAIGSRRSSHSAIIGSNDLPFLALEPLGARRETASRKLASRAVALLEAAPDITNSASMSNLELVTLVKDMLLFVDPTSSALPSMIPLLTSQSKGLSALGVERNFEESIRTNFDLADARIAVRQGVAPSLDIDDLQNHCYFTPDEHVDAVIRLSDPYKEPPSPLWISGWILNIQMSSLRRQHALEVEARTEPWKTLPSFRHQWSLLDLSIRYVRTRLASSTPASTPAPSSASFPAPSFFSSNSASLLESLTSISTTEFGDLNYSNPPTPRSSRVLISPDSPIIPATKEDYLGQIPDLFLTECALLKTAERIASSSAPVVAAGKEDEALKGVMERMEVRRMARVRWLKSLRWLGASLEDIRNTAADAHWIARRLEWSFSLVEPDWVGLAVRGALEAEAGEGELAEAGVEWEDLEMILHAFDKASVVFASSAQQAQQLRARIAQARPAPPELAADMVAKALAELSLPDLAIPLQSDQFDWIV